MGRKSILVVDDEQAIRETVQLALELAGYREVLFAADGEEAIRVLARFPPPCLILLDLMMPVMNGWEFIERIKQSPELARIPIVMITAYGQRAGNLGVEGVILKPLDLDVLYKTVDRWCGRPEPRK